jgi:peptidoglycan hydrolase CwlO-like protein
MSEEFKIVLAFIGGLSAIVGIAKYFMDRVDKHEEKKFGLKSKLEDVKAEHAQKLMSRLESDLEKLKNHTHEHNVLIHSFVVKLEQSTTKLALLAAKVEDFVLRTEKKLAIIETSFGNIIHRKSRGDS